MAGTVKLHIDKWFRRGEEEEVSIPEEKESNQIVYLEIDSVTPSPYQTRTEFDEYELNELAQSIKEYGVIQPIVVRKTPGGYELVAGERRVRASRLSGLATIPALVVEMSDEKAAAVTLIENVQRTALNYLEEAEAYQLLINEFGFKQEELARRVGKSQSAVANKLRLLKLPTEVKSIIKVNVISERHARALLQLDDLNQQLNLVKLITEKDLTVKAAEDLIHKLKARNGESSDKDQSADEDPNWLKARTYVNSIKEIVYQAKESGINIVCMENRQPEGMEILIKVSNLRFTDKINSKSKAK
ncbi:MAG: ParB/RepB/Spo0J family partition protein [Methylocystaceae bacterium]